MKSSSYNAPKIALVSREYEADDYVRHLESILKTADDAGCGQVLFSLFSLHRKHRDIDLSWAIQNRKNLRQIFLETGDLFNERDLRTEIWSSNLDYPLLFKRQFAYSSEPDVLKQRFISQFQQRVIMNTKLCICGEIGIIKLKRSLGSIADPFNYINLLSEHDVQVILNPFHTKAFRYEIALKHRELSKNKRWCISVWNQYKSRGRDSRYPWSVFFNGRLFNQLVREIPIPIPARPDIRIGILNPSVSP